MFLEIHLWCETCGPLDSQHVYSMARVPFVFEFESEWLNDNSATKQLLNYHWAISEKWSNAILLFVQLYPNLMNGNSMTVLSLNCHSAIQIQTQMQRELRYFENTLAWSLVFA